MTEGPPPVPGRRPPSRRPPAQRKRPSGHAKGAPAADLRPQAVTCVNCAGSLKIRDQKEAAMLVCEYCGTAMDVSVPGLAEKVGEYAKEKRGGPINVGDVAKISGHQFTVLGRVLYEQIDFGVYYEWEEFQLYNRQHGYIFLGLENGHWMVFREMRISKSLPHPKNLHLKETFYAEQNHFRVFEAGGVAKIGHVEGELSWIARKGDAIKFMDAIAPPDMVSAEWTTKELEWYKGRYQTPQQVAKAFKKKVEDLPKPEGVAPSQLFERSDAQRQKMKMGMVAAAILLVGLFWALGKGGTVVLADSIPFQDYMSDRGGFSSSFDVPSGSHIYRLEMSANIKNTWIASSFAIVNEADEVVADAEVETGYYEGRDADGYWSEGSQSSAQLMRLKGPGTYKLNVFGQTDASGQRQAPQMSIELREGVLPSRYLLVALLLVLVYPLKEVTRKFTFESRRWPSDDDDD